MSKENDNKKKGNFPISDVNHSLSKADIERQIKGYIGLRNLAIYHNENEAVENFDKLINDLEMEKSKLNCC